MHDGTASSVEDGGRLPCKMRGRSLDDVTLLTLAHKQFVVVLLSMLPPFEFVKALLTYGQSLVASFPCILQP